MLVVIDVSDDQRLLRDDSVERGTPGSRHWIPEVLLLVAMLAAIPLLVIFKVSPPAGAGAAVAVD